MFNLIRTLPNGTEKVQGPVARKRDAASLALFVLTDNGLATRRAANGYAQTLDMMPVGTAVTHEASGYKFRIEAV